MTVKSGFHDKEAHSIVDKLRRIEHLLPAEDRRIAVLLLACWEQWGVLVRKEKQEAALLFARFRMRLESERRAAA